MELHSQSIGQLALALSLAQGEMESASKNSNNPYFKSKYADLSEVWRVIRGPLSKNNLSVIQSINGTYEKPIITTILAHQSGEYISSTLELSGEGAGKDGEKKFTAQTMGSAISYGRRYALSALVGVCQEDDDGNSASAQVKETVKSCSPESWAKIEALLKSTNTLAEDFLSNFGFKKAEEFPESRVEMALKMLAIKLDKMTGQKI